MRRFRLLLLRLLYSMSTRGPKRPSNGTFFIFMSFICVTKPSDMQVRRIPISLSIVPWLVMVLTSCNSQRGGWRACHELLQHRRPVSPFRFILPSHRDVSDTLVAGAGRVGKRLLARCFQPLVRVLICQLKKPRKASIGLLLNPVGGKNRINGLVCIVSNLPSLFMESVTVPLQVFLMIVWHVFRNGAVLPLSSK